MKDIYKQRITNWINQKFFLYRPYVVRRSNKHLPDFLIIGAQKSGTTALLRNLEHHPGIFLAMDPVLKEVKFFSRDSRWRRGVDWYKGHFPNGHLLQGEKDPECLYKSVCHNRIKTIAPHAKLIILLRNPVDRAYSQWNHYNQAYETASKEWGWTKTTFEHALEINEHLLKRGEYIDQIEHLLGIFPREQVYIGIAERLKENPVAEINNILTFLEVPHTVLNPGNWHTRTYPHPMKDSTRQALAEYFQPFNERLFSFMGDIIPEWEEGS